MYKNNNNQLIWIGEDSKINVLQKRDYTYAKNFMRHLLTNKIFSSGIAPNLITELAKSYRIIEGNEINQLSKKFIDNDGSKILYHFGVDDESVFLNDLNSSSLFDSKKMIICWGINKLTKKGKEDFAEFSKISKPIYTFLQTYACTFTR